MNKKKTKILMLMIIVVVFLSGCNSVEEENEYPNTIFYEDEDSSVQVETVIDEVFSIYESNEIKFEQSFKDKIISISGYVNNIERVDDVVILTLDNGDVEPDKYVLCKFDEFGIDKNYEKLGELSKGDYVHVGGKCFDMADNSLLIFALIVRDDL